MFEEVSTRKIEGIDRFNRGLSLDAEGKTKEAVEAYREALNIYPELAEGHYNLGLGLALLGKNEEAIRAWKRAVWLNRDFQQSLIAAFDIDHEIREAVVSIPNT